MKVLILGGTRFLGRALVDEALKRGHEVTMFNRGTNTEVFPDVEQLIGDRNGDVSQLENRKWDVVMDTCGMTPRQIKKIADVLGDNVEHLTYISSISVYPDWIPLNIAEDYHVHSIPPAEVLNNIGEGTISPYEYYGGMKVACEVEAESHWPKRVLNVRAGLLVGSFDYTDRLPYWVQRVAQGGTVLVPGRPDRPVQFIDVKDLTAWVFNMAEDRKAGTFNVTGPDYELTMEEFLNTCKAVTGSDAEFVWADEQFMLEQKVQPWTEMPLWIPEQFALGGASEPWKGSSFISIEKAVTDGLSFRPLEDTLSDIYQDVQAREAADWKAGISREREKELLEEWLLANG
ncbi:NAD-dependent epimerase/dehydratase family protein [Sporosarcina highlanderae]|uniref:NAD-dependent epimerase/dehydratase family protein n=1 Tax=Sporosarcina highlanderae TaxID=3035916 RepID=A0ABT8JUD7_9BACL|nr:NAD-dependent epimerase/dehydratase family protein [Sporosarcina highlanderae]MDN4608781.1 NAD-dependent epimerase/dehydratase family protein [Sporosarcina highlanderae]